MGSKFPTSPIQYGSHGPQEAPRPLNMACETEELMCAVQFALRIQGRGSSRNSRACWLPGSGLGGVSQRFLIRVCLAGAAQDRRAGPQSPRRGLVLPGDSNVRTAASSASWGRQDHLILLKAGAGLGETPRFRATGGVGAKVAPNSRRQRPGRLFCTACAGELRSREH